MAISTSGHKEPREEDVQASNPFSCPDTCLLAATSRSVALRCIGWHSRLMARERFADCMREVGQAGEVRILCSLPDWIFRALSSIGQSASLLSWKLAIRTRPGTPHNGLMLMSQTRMRFEFATRHKPKHRALIYRR